MLENYINEAWPTPSNGRSELQMTRNVAVVALDAADYRLLRRWDCQQLLLESHGPLETVSHSLDEPHTLEIWPTVATGCHPREHGVGPTEDHDTEWSNPIIDVARRMGSPVLPSGVRTWLGRRLLDTGAVADHSFPMTDHEHVFDAVYTWPGVTPAAHLGRAWDLLNGVQDGQFDDRELERELFTLTHDELNWTTDRTGLVGVHCHVLDVAGHAYCRREDRLRHYYERLGYLVAALRTYVDEVVLLSDHGIQVSWLDDDSPGDHSFDAFVATTMDTSLPSHVLDVADWLDAHRPIPSESGEQGDATADATREQLEDLGYLG